MKKIIATRKKLYRKKLGDKRSWTPQDKKEIVQKLLFHKMFLHRDCNSIQLEFHSFKTKMKHERKDYEKPPKRERYVRQQVIKEDSNTYKHWKENKYV